MTASFPSTVLVVDDEAISREVLGRVLVGRGLAVERAESGEEAIILLERLGFGCVITDKNLPGIDGLEVMRRAGALQPHCARILITAYSSTQSVIEALRLGAIDYIEKPFDDIDLVGERVELAIANHRARHERHLLGERLREARQELDAKAREVAAHRTELDIFEEVVQLKAEQAAAPHIARRMEIEARLEARERAVADVRDGLTRMVQHLREAAAKRDMPPEDFQDVLSEAALALGAHIRHLGGG